MDLFDMDVLDAQNQNFEEKKQRIGELEKLILRYQKSYYDGEGEISDAEFDSLWDELKALDPMNPILHRVGSDSGNFAKIRHIMPMGSQEKAANPEQFQAWALKHNYPEYLVEYKLDGASLELQYSHGQLRCAVTRGDGEIGDDITANALKMNGVPSVLLDTETGATFDFTGGIRGEVIMTHQVHRELYSDKANCRNAANGLMKRKDGEGSQHLCLITYDIWSSQEPQPFSDEEDKITLLSRLGFQTSPLEICHSVQEVIDYRVKVMEQRKNLDYDIDGLVIKERRVDHQDASRDRPDRQIAFKFSLEEAVSVLRQVEWGENGATYTPVGIFDPVELNGTTVQRASLVNPRTIRGLDLKIGNHVVVVKRGEIIPKIEAVVPHDDDSTQLSQIEFPVKCSSCGSQLVDEDTRLFCPNRECPKRRLHQLQKWIQVLDIRDFGTTLINSLFSHKVVNHISDIYSLTEKDLVPYFLNSESIQNEKESLGAKKVIESINSHRSISLEKFIAGFDIENIGETVVEKLVASGFNTLEKILDADSNMFETVYGFAEVMARTLSSGLKENRQEMEMLVSRNFIQIKSVSGGILEGKSFCFTGELKTMKRADAQNLVKEKGGVVKSSVVKGLSYLVTNDTGSGSSKNAKARELGTAIINEEEFIKMVGL